MPARWVDFAGEQTGGGFPEKVTENECNYCATCQTSGRLPADRPLSRLLKDDWPRSIDDL